MRRRRVETILMWIVYAAIAVATFRHTAWGFGTLETTLLAPIFSQAGAVFWITGAMSAFALDAGLAGTVLAIQLRVRRDKPTRTLFFLVAFVAAMATTTQLLYAVTHAVPTEQIEINVASWLQPYAYALWDLRVAILPALLPGLSVAYAFVARDTARPAPSQPVAYEDFMDRFRKELAAQAGEKEKVGKYDLVQAPRVGPTRRRPPKEPTDPVGPAGLQPDDVVAI